MKPQELRFFNLALLLCLFLSACGDGPDAPATVAANDEQASKKEAPIASIQKRYADINNWLNTATLRMDSLPYDCANDPSGGTIRFFRHEGELVMLRHDYYLGDHFGATETYYLRDERPIFVFVESGTWNFAGPETEDAIAPHTEDNISEFRYYFSDYQAGETQQSLRCLQKDYVIRSWVDIPLNKDEISNKTIECDTEALAYLNKFKELVNSELNNFGC